MRIRRLASMGWLLVIFGMLAAVADAQENVRVVRQIPAESRSRLYTSNRDPLLPSPLIKLPIGSITPEGWLRNMLEIETQGMSGRLAEISPWLKFDSSAWADKEGKRGSGWEELPYWLKGYADLGYVLKDEAIIGQARKWIEAVLASQREDGWFGPRALLTSLDGKPDLWSHMLMLNVLQSYYEYSGDQRVLPFMTRYFQWQDKLPAESFGVGYWPKIRAGDNIESVYWLYNRTGDAWLLGLAKKIHANMADWTGGVCDWHNVNIAQGFREPAIYYMQAGQPKYLDATERNYQTVMGLYGQFPGGGFAGDENCRKGYGDPRQGFETCGIVEFMHSFEMLTKISGQPIWSDRCEELAFNTLPTALTPAMKALRYLTCANEVQLDAKDHHPGFDNKGNQLAYTPSSLFRCCQHNVAQGWPFFAEELWLATSDDGLCASFYSACKVTTKVGDGSTVTIVEETDYPFSDTVQMKLSASKAARFPLYLRVPRWSGPPVLKINGKAVDVKAEQLSYIVVDRQWSDGDAVSLQLPMSIGVRTWTKSKDSVSVDYGPLTFSLKIGERWHRYGGSDAWPEWEVFPTTPWNYGLVLDAKDAAKSFELVRSEIPLARQPFTPETVPLLLRAKAKRIPAWQLDKTGLIEVLQASPVKSDEPVETVTLIPMGAARLRIAAFPIIGDGPDAKPWAEQVKK